MKLSTFIKKYTMTLALFVVGPDGKPLRKISAVNYTATPTEKQHNKYVEKALLNGKEITDGIIRHSDITSGGKLTFYMSNTYTH